jgi:glucose dehydrogenase
MERLGLFQLPRPGRGHLSATGAITLLLLYGLLLRALYAQPQSPEPDLTQLQADDNQWVMPAKNYASTRYSGLDQITADNVKHLQPAWTFSTGVLRGHEAAPLVVRHAMYIVTPYPNILYALDLTQPGAPMKWSNKPKPTAAAQGVACCAVGNRGAAYAKGKIYFNTLDNHTVAVDAETGKEVWKTKVGDINRGESMTMAPLVVKNKVLVGNSGGEFGVRGWLTALDAESGTVAWRAYSTGPDTDVLIGATVSTLLSPRPWHGPGRFHLTARGLEDRWRHPLGLDLV